MMAAAVFKAVIFTAALAFLAVFAFVVTPPLIADHDVIGDQRRASSILTQAASPPTRSPAG